MATTVPQSGTDQCCHKVDGCAGCWLSSTPLCCACMDKREILPGYVMYVDGEGTLQSGSRWLNYCESCKDFWSKRYPGARNYPIQDLETLSSTPEAQPLRAQTSTAVEVGESESADPGDSPQGAEMSQSNALLDLDRYLEILVQPQVRDVRVTLTQSPTFSPGTSGGAINFDTGILLGHRNDTQDAMNARPPLLRGHEGEHDGGRENQHGHNRRHRDRVHPMVQALGTREDVQRDDYESPIGGMFSRAWGRYHQAEVARHEQNPTGYQPDTTIPQQTGGFQGASANNPWDTSGPAITPNPLIWAGVHPDSHQHADVPRTNNWPARIIDLDGHRRASNRTDTANMAASQNWTTVSDFTLRAMQNNDTNITHAHPSTHESNNTNAHTATRGARIPQALPAPILLDDSRRPPATMESDQLMINGECKVCMVQLVDTVFLPCGHVALCRWCAESELPDMLLRRPPRRNNYDPGVKHPLCPICKSWVKSKHRIFFP